MKKLVEESRSGFSLF
jgi:hypothetical protein